MSSYAYPCIHLFTQNPMEGHILCNTKPYHAMSYLAIPCHDEPDHVILYHTILYHTKPYHEMSNHAILYYAKTIPCYAVPCHVSVPYTMHACCHVLLYNTMSYHCTMPKRNMTSCVVPCCMIPCQVIPYHVLYHVYVI